ncbi:hypothetical protein QYE76_006932 [Lolium multiflorum]|uniref:DUF7792 domain-containing protein n=1 Tax=Lolium multiflorum TaxID=4521 RepID=A0AAD8RX79_LOLMU|nr:hypothetical protein QYE76_006932 [Lolium multiflorum]
MTCLADSSKQSSSQLTSRPFLDRPFGGATTDVEHKQPACLDASSSIGMMVDPLGLVTAILTAVQLIRSAASTASQNKEKCLELAERVKNLGEVLPSFAHAAANDPATARVLERLRDAVGEALTLIQSCKTAGMFSGKYSSRKAGDLDSVDKRINNCIMDLNLISQARANNGTEAAGKVPAQAGHVDYHSSCYQAQGGAASAAHVAWPPTPQHAWGTPQGYYHQPPGYAQWAPGPAHYPASPAPSGSNLSSYCALPTVNKILKRAFR